MSWFIDNVNVVYILLGIVALGFVTAFWLNKRVKFLAYAAIPVVLIALFWLLTQFVVTDRQQIEKNLKAMGEAAVAKDHAALLKHFSRDFRYKELGRDQIAELARGTIDKWQISEVKIWEYDVIEIRRANQSAKVTFKVTVFSRVADRPPVVLCISDFVLEDDQWKMRTIEFRNALKPDEPMPGAP